MSMTNTTVATKPLIDLSRLKRRPIDLKTVKVSRFLFPGWEAREVTGLVTTKAVTEQEWNSIKDPTKKTIVIDNEHVPLKIFWSTEHLGVAAKGCWCLEPSSRIIARGWRRQEVFFLQNATYEDLVKATEQYLLLAHEKYATDVFNYEKAQWNNPRDWREFQLAVDRAMATWKQSQFIP